MTLKMLDTFAGIGGFSYAAENLVGGFKTVQFIEIDPYCQQILNKNFPNIPIHNDITTYTAEPYSADIICGGFPCQDISTAGRGKGITEETRSGLFYELIRVIRMVRPKYVILENVAAILTNGLDIVLGELSEAGYDAEWSVISASSLGACHQRSRWWLIAYPNKRSCSSQEQCSTFNRSNEGIRLDNENLRGTKQVVTNPIGFRSRSQSKIQTGRDSSSGCGGSRDVTNTNNNGRQRREYETRNQNVTGQDSQSKWSANTNDTKRQSDDGDVIKESRIDGDLSGSSNRGKATFTKTGAICELFEETDNNQRINGKNNNKEDNDRTLVSQGQSRFQLSIDRKLEGDKATFEGDKIRQGDDNSSEQRMDNEGSNVTNTKGSNRDGDETKQGDGKARTQEIFRNRNSSKTSHTWRSTKHRLNPNWKQYVSQPTICRGDDGLSTKLDAKQRVQRLKMLGNSIVPQVAAIPLQRVIQLEREQQ